MRVSTGSLYGPGGTLRFPEARLARIAGSFAALGAEPDGGPLTDLYVGETLPGTSPERRVKNTE